MKYRQTALFLLIVGAVFISGCMHDQPPNVKITDSYFSESSIESGESTSLFVKVKNNENEDIASVIIKIDVRDSDKQYVTIDEPIKDLGEMKFGEDSGLKNFEISAIAPVGDLVKYEIIVKVFVGDEETDNKNLQLTVKRQ